MKILIADDHDLLRSGIRTLLSTDPDFEICGEAMDGQDAIKKAKEANPDIVIMDVSMPNMDGVAATREIKRTLPHVKVLILTQHENQDIFQAALRAGADGYIGKWRVNSELLDALKRIGMGKTYFSSPSLSGPEITPDVREILRRSALFERAVRESEERFRLVADTAPVMIWMSGSDKLCTYFNRGWLEFTGRPIEAELGNGWAQSLHPEDLQRCLKRYAEAFEAREPFRMEYRLRRHDGEYRWILDSGVPRFQSDGSFAGYIGSCIDVTERKLAEEALSTVSKKLIEAQEQERTRIARELHDDVSQRIALVAVDLQSLQQGPEASRGEQRQAIAHAISELDDLGMDVQALSHRLHSSRLDYLGLEAASAGLCREVSRLHKLEINFHSDNIPKDVPKDVALSLFRVLEEGLQNAIKHSGSREFQVSLSSGSNEIELTIHDSGVGFDQKQVRKGQGLGLTSIEERVKLVNGELSIDSQPQRGTTLHARVPLTSHVNSAAASI